MSDRYESPLCKRYASPQMQRLFSDDTKFTTWRRLWVALAESQQELGLPISQAQLDQMKAHVADINYPEAERIEAEIRHDVMAHIRAYGRQCPLAAPIIHLGATSCYVGDNTDIIIQRQALLMIKDRLINTLGKLYAFADAHKALACLAFTHLQAAQPTTLGKRAVLWMQELCFDLAHIDFALSQLKLLGCKGTTGTGASFLALFEGDGQKVALLEQKIAARMGFEGVYPVSGQTYSRKIDYLVLSALSSIAQSAYKFSGDIRLLSHMKEVDEPFEESQVGSSAMAYKRNPMRSERMASLARYVVIEALNPAMTASAQWLERTLDDSANRRLTIPGAFLAVDAILLLYSNITQGLVVYPRQVQKHLDAELPFMATENILMHCVKQGGDRQVLHERIRQHAMAAARQIKLEGGENDLIARILGDPAFGIAPNQMKALLQAEHFTGMAQAQTETFLAEVKGLIAENPAAMGETHGVTV